MKKVLAIIVSAGLLLLPLSWTAIAADSSDSSKPPIGQPLVREGDFAVSLATSLNLTKTDDEAGAESILSSKGIAPRNGWIADYPVTPDVYTDVQNAARKAGDSGGLPCPGTGRLKPCNPSAPKLGFPSRLPAKIMIIHLTLNTTIAVPSMTALTLPRRI